MYRHNKRTFTRQDRPSHVVCPLIWARSIYARARERKAPVHHVSRRTPRVVLHVLLSPSCWASAVLSPVSDAAEKRLFFTFASNRSCASSSLAHVSIFAGETLRPLGLLFIVFKTPALNRSISPALTSDLSGEPGILVFSIPVHLSRFHDS